MEKDSVKSHKAKSGGLKSKSQKVRAKILSSYYGKPIKDMKLICVTGTTGKTVVAHYVHEILVASGEQVAVLASDQPIKVGTLHKFLNDAWKAGANYVVVTTPVESLKDNVFYGLPVHIAAMTNFITSSLTGMTPEEYLEDEKTLFNMKPEIVILNHDDLSYDKFANFTGKNRTITYGTLSSDIRINTSKLYTKGVEANLTIDNKHLNVATFVCGEIAVHYMACAVAIANALGIEKHDTIIDGIANYCPEGTI